MTRVNFLLVVIAAQVVSKIFIFWNLVFNRNSDYIKAQNIFFVQMNALGGLLIVISICLREINIDYLPCNIFIHLIPIFIGLYYLPIIIQNLKILVMIKLGTYYDSEKGQFFLATVPGREYKLLKNHNFYYAVYIVAFVSQISVSSLVFMVDETNHVSSQYSCISYKDMGLFLIYGGVYIIVFSIESILLIFMKIIREREKNMILLIFMWTLFSGLFFVFKLYPREYVDPSIFIIMEVFMSDLILFVGPCRKMFNKKRNPFHVAPGESVVVVNTIYDLVVYDVLEKDIINSMENDLEKVLFRRLYEMERCTKLRNVGTEVHKKNLGLVTDALHDLDDTLVNKNFNYEDITSYVNNKYNNILEMDDFKILVNAFKNEKLFNSF